MDDIVIDIIDVRVGFLFVVDGDLLKEFGRVSLLDKDIPLLYFYFSENLHRWGNEDCIDYFLPS